MPTIFHTPLRQQLNRAIIQSRTPPSPVSSAASLTCDPSSAASVTRDPSSVASVTCDPSSLASVTRDPPSN